MGGGILERWPALARRRVDFELDVWVAGDAGFFDLAERRQICRGANGRLHTGVSLALCTGRRL